MARKLTALELAAKSGKLAGFDWKKIVYPLLLAAGISGVTYSGYQVAADHWYQSGKATVEGAARKLGQKSRQVLQEHGRRIADLGTDEEVLTALGSGNENDLVACEASLSRRLPKSLRIRVLNPVVENLTKQPFPGLGYRELALLLQAKNTLQLHGPGIALAHTQNANLSWAIPVADQTGLKGFVLS